MSAVPDAAWQRTCANASRIEIPIPSDDVGPTPDRPVESRTEANGGGAIPLGLLGWTSERDDVDASPLEPADAGADVEFARPVAGEVLAAEVLGNSHCTHAVVRLVVSQSSRRLCERCERGEGRGKSSFESERHSGNRK